MDPMATTNVQGKGAPGHRSAAGDGRLGKLAETMETILDIEAGLADSAAGRVTETGEVRGAFGLE